MKAFVLASACVLAMSGSFAPAPARAAEDAAPAALSAPAADAATSASVAAPDTAPAAEGGASAPAAEGPLTQSATAPEANPYGLSALWGQGDLVARTTLAILALMSFGSWYILITKLFEQRAFFSSGNAARKRFAQVAGLKEGTEGLAKSSAFRAVAEEGIAAVERHSRGLASEVSLVDWTGQALNRAIDSIASKLQGGLAFLATVGSTAPFIGLFGTVWGIYHALIAIGVAGQASIDKVAGPVGEALIMTAIGLAVAVPAVLGYNILIRRNKAALEQARRFAIEVEARILTRA
ncbi:MotA/TolQ/ExbB proton channel family protein [Parvibaculum sedimenti]|uniref:Biopolymer transport protein ExbB n=2 Tax=Parvibaculum sedimenti TaxID=2608632 RepID=A0A6N6VNC0_9HYPH|nr:MotA/TolQ/ExbB proton channel family protein [Parvibaculum sedimenti]KAB7742717.1 MotA/TolQ/ExbB proton channel family protein [Parvibaculum sedimenti]